ncbi:MAG: hypothetical protein K2F94_05950 [Muribaculaceae bacterium]|nr:hypothetical protein [Muribaculaceae bacterium]
MFKSNTQAWYQCESEERDKDGDFRCKRVTSDEYDKYWKGEDLLMRNVWQQKSGFFARLSGPKFNAQKCPQCGYNSRRFVCPHCFNWLPTEMIENGAEIISVIGSPQSGKTNYIVALIHQLRKHGYKMDLQVAPTQIYRDGHKEESTQNLFKKFDTQLFGDGSVLMKTAVNKPEIPWIFHLSQQSTGKNIYLVFYDTAGEKFKENLKNNVKYLKESTGVIVILDVLSVSEIKRILKKKGFDEFAGKPSASFQEIQDALANFDDSSIQQKPFAFVFSKFDAVIDNTDSLNFNSDEFVIGNKKLDSGYLKSGVVDLNKINAISQTIEEALEDEWDEGDFCHFAQKWGSKKNISLPRNKRDPNDPDNNYKFFGVSAFGTMPDESENIEKVEPYRVMDPLVWILHKLGQFDIPTKK